MKKITTLLRTISIHPSENYITLGDLAICWGYADIGAMSANGYTYTEASFPITFDSEPLVIPFIAAGFGAGRTIMIQAVRTQQTQTAAKLFLTNLGGGATSASQKGAGWVAIGFVGG